LGGREVWKDWWGWRIGRIHLPVMNVFLLLHVHCVRYYYSDNRTERLVHSYTVVLHVVLKHINKYTYISL
jgi:hypothetical protein